MESWELQVCSAEVSMQETWSVLKTGFHSCRLSLCEKALAEYLETKRVTFPRFYFISSTDLLDILSKGTQPKQVMALEVLCSAD